MGANESTSENIKPNTKSSAHIIVIRLSAMGDVAMSVPVLTNLLREYPELKLTVVTRKFFTPMFASLKQVRVLEADVQGKHKGLIGLWRLANALKKEDADAVADLHNVLRSKILKILFAFTGIPFRQIDKGRKEKKALTSAKHKVFGPLKTTHERYADVFRNLGYPFKLDTNNIQPARDLSSNVLEIVGDHNMHWLGIAPFAAFVGKMYPLQLMERVIGHFDNTDKYKIILFGGGIREIDQLKRIAVRFKNTLVLADKIKFADELAVISHLDVMLAMDSGNAHLASIYGIPTITVWGVTHPFAGFYPYGQPTANALLSDRNKYPEIPTSVYGNKFPKGYEQALAEIAPETIIRKIEALGL